MMEELLLILLLAVGGSSRPDRLEKTRLPDCRKVIVQDSDRRAFDDRTSFTLDMDGDGRPDTFTSRTYTLKANRKVSGRLTAKARETHWITFDLEISSGRIVKPLFKYDYGTDRADYWVYAFVPCNLNGDRRTDLLFYSGDDTSEETIILVNKGSTFRVLSRKVRHVDF